MTNAKTITPSGNVDVSHYKITVNNVAEDVHVTSDYLVKGETFTVTNVPAGLWSATVDAYVLNESNYVKVATATSVETRVSAGESATLTVTLNTLDDSLSGDITVTLKMPSELDDENDVFWYTYSIQGTGQRNDVMINHETREQGTVGINGLATISINDALNQGSYLLTVNVYDSADEGTTNVDRTGVDIMRLVAGLEAAGQINLDSQLINEEGFKVQITDKVGDILTPETVDGKDTYELDATDSETEFTVTLSEVVPEGFVMEWYVDGALVDATTADNTAYILSLEKGKHSVVGIMRDDAMLMSVGSVSFDVNVKTKIEFNEPGSEYEKGPVFSIDNVDLFFSNVSGNPVISTLKHENSLINARIATMKYTPASTAMSISTVDIENETGTLDAWLTGYQIVDRQTGKVVDFADVMNNEEYRGIELVLDYVSYLSIFAQFDQDESVELLLTLIEQLQEDGCSLLVPFVGIPIIDGKISLNTSLPIVSLVPGSAVSSDLSLLENFDWDAYDFQAVPVRIWVDASNGGEISVISVNDGVSLSEVNIASQYSFFSALAGMSLDEMLSDDPYEDPDSLLSFPFYIHGYYLITDFDVFEKGQFNGQYIDFCPGPLELYLMQGDSDMPLLIDMSREERAEYLWTEPVELEFKPDSRVQIALIPAGADEVNEALVYITRTLQEGEIYPRYLYFNDPDISYINGNIEIKTSRNASLVYTTDGSTPMTGDPEDGDEVIFSETAVFVDSSTVQLPVTDFKEGDIIRATGFIQDKYRIIYGRSWSDTEFEVTKEMVDPFTYELNEDGQSYTVTGLKSYISWEDSELFEIPAIYNEKPVTIIGKSAFEGRTDIVGSVVIPNSVTSIGESAFSDCSALTSITIPDSVTSIGTKAFLRCSSIEDINIPDGVTSIEPWTFGYCYALETVEISNDSQLEIFDMYAFNGCSALASITIPDSVITIGSYAFSRCSALTDITIPDNVRTIKNSAFSGCSSFESIIIPEGVTTIGKNAFSGCDALTNVNIPRSVTTIESYAFNDCPSLKIVEISSASQLKSIAQGVFSECSALTSIIIPEGVTLIGPIAFRNCISLESVALPSTLETIGGGRGVGFGAFEGCSSLTEIIIPDNVTSIREQAFKDCSSLESITIPKGVTTIGYGSFQNCSALVEVNLPSTLTSIEGDYSGGAFEGCSSLQSIDIPDGVTSIKYRAFGSCSSLTEINIPDSVTSIGTDVFDGCNNLTDIYCEAVSEPEGWASNWLGDCDATVHWGYTGA